MIIERRLSNVESTSKIRWIAVQLAVGSVCGNMAKRWFCLAETCSYVQAWRKRGKSVAEPFLQLFWIRFIYHQYALCLPASFPATSMPTRKKKSHTQSNTPSHQGSRARATPRTKETFACSCTQRCKGRLKYLTRVTYLKHAPFQELDAQRDLEQTTIHSPPSIATGLSSGNSRNTTVLSSHSYVYLVSLTFHTTRTFCSPQPMCQIIANVCLNVV